MVTTMVVAEKYTRPKSISCSASRPSRLTDELVPRRQPFCEEDIHANRGPSDNDKHQVNMPSLNDIIWMIELSDTEDHRRDEVRHTGKAKPPPESADARGSGNCQKTAR